MISGFDGVYRDDAEARAVYSEAAGIARMMPRAVAVPAHIGDVVTLVGWARATHTPLVPRGSGSSMSGGAIGDGVIVDLGRLTDIGAVDVARRRVHVQPGAIRKDVDTAARAVGLRFPPDPSSGAFCTIGGMISTNAAGSHTLKFGATRAWVTALDCIFDDGTRATLTRGGGIPTGTPALDRLARTANAIRARGAAATHAGVRKESSGYGVAAFAEHGDAIDLVIGSEGTLALIVGAELALIEQPGATSSVLGAFTSLDDAVMAAGRAREAGAAACELLDRTYLEIAAQSPLRHTSLPDVPAGTEAVLLAEAEGADADSAAAAARTIADAFSACGAAAVRLALTPVDEVAVWELRHAASPTLAAMDPAIRSLQFVEDGAVPPDRFAAYVTGVRAALMARGVRGVIFGHAGDAHAHVNPLVDTRRPTWRAEIDALLGDVVALTAELGGTLAGEHGDGRLRTPLLDRVWPAEALEAFRLVKTAFDPEGIFNPGVKVAQPNQPALDAIKYDPSLPPLPARAEEALAVVARDRAYHRHRLDLLDRPS